MGALNGKRMEALKLANSKSVIKRFFLPIIAKIRLRRLVMEKLLTLFVEVHNAKGLSAMDITGTSDPYVYVHAERNKSIRKPSSHIPQSLSDTLSLYKTKIVYANLNPVWNESCLVSNLTGFDYIVVTVVDHDKVGLHDFLGQV